MTDATGRGEGYVLWRWHPVLTPLLQDHRYWRGQGRRDLARATARAYALARWHPVAAELLMAAGRDQERDEHTCY